jgi:catalase (peroxidase I)
MRLFAFLAVSAQGCPFLRGIDKNLPADLESRRLAHNLDQSPVCLNRREVFSPTQEGICDSYLQTLSAFSDYIKSLDDMGRSQFYGVVVRLAFHDAGEFNQNTDDALGSDGCLSNSGSNYGLTESDGLVNTVIESMWQNVCGSISRADFWVLLAKIVLEESDPTHQISIPFQYGRVDSVSCEDGAGRLPGAQAGKPEFERVFVDQMGLTLSEGVTLLGAHTLGHVHPEFSGYGYSRRTKGDLTTNAWDYTPHQFDNQYFKVLQTVSI